MNVYIFFLFEDLKDGLSETMDLLPETKLFSFRQRKKGKLYMFVALLLQN